MVFTTALYLSLSWTWWIQSTLFQPVSLTSILLLCFHLRLGHVRGFLSGLPAATETFMIYLHVTPSQSIYSWLYHPNNIWWGILNMKLISLDFSPLIVGSSTFYRTLLLNTLSLSWMYYPAYALCDAQFMTSTATCFGTMVPFSGSHCNKGI
jgi:hypothetical protein